MVPGYAHDLVDQVGAPRLPFPDVPLSDAAGRPLEAGSQALTQGLALQLPGGAQAQRNDTIAAAPG